MKIEENPPEALRRYFIFYNLLRKSHQFLTLQKFLRTLALLGTLLCLADQITYLATATPGEVGDEKHDAGGVLGVKPTMPGYIPASITGGVSEVSVVDQPPPYHSVTLPQPSGSGETDESAQIVRVAPPVSRWRVVMKEDVAKWILRFTIGGCCGLGITGIILGAALNEYRLWVPGVALTYIICFGLCCDSCENANK